MIKQGTIILSTNAVCRVLKHLLGFAVAFSVVSCSVSTETAGDSTSADGEPTIIEAAAKSSVRGVVSADPLVGRSADFAITEPAQFLLASSQEKLEAYVKVDTFSVKWEDPLNRIDFDFVLSLAEECSSSPIKVLGDLTVLETQLGPLDEGTYYVCVQAIKQEGLLTNASNGPYAIHVDLTAPEAFEAETPKSVIATATPTFSWNESKGADYYRVDLAADEACETVEASADQIFGVEYTFIDSVADGVYHLCIYAYDYAQNRTLNTTVASFTIDTKAPVLSSLSAPAGSSTYGPGDTFLVYANFSEEVTFTSGMENPTLVFEAGDSDISAEFHSVIDSDSLAFLLTIDVRHSSDTLGIVGDQSQIHLQDATLEDDYGNSTTGEQNVVAAVTFEDESVIIIDSTAPTAPSQKLILADDIDAISSDSFDNDADIYLRWGAGSDAESSIVAYRVEVFDQSSCGGVGVISGDIGVAEGDRRFTFTGATHPNQYSFKVHAEDEGGNISESECSDAIQIDTVAPVAGTSLVLSGDDDSASAVASDYDDDTEAFAHWVAGTDALAGITRQELLLYETADCSATAVSVTELSATATSQALNVTPNKTYSFQITGVDNAGNESSSPCSNAIIVDTLSPTPPSLLAVTKGAPGSAHVSWPNQSSVYLNWSGASDAASLIEAYEVHHYETGDCSGTATELTALSSSTSSVQLVGKSDTDALSFKVVVIDYSGNSATSSCSSPATIDLTDPSAATVLKTTESLGGANKSYTTSANIYMEWTLGSDAGSGVASQVVSLFDDGTCTGTETTYDLSDSVVSQIFNGSDETTYSYRILTEDVAGNQVTSSCSAAIVIDTQPPNAPTGLSVGETLGGAGISYNNDGGFYLRWTAGTDASAGVDSQDVRFFSTTDCSGASLATTVADGVESLEKTGLGDGSYSFDIVVTDLAGNSVTSVCSSTSSAPIQVDTVLPNAAGALFASETAGGASAANIDLTEVYFRWTPGTDDDSGMASQHIYAYSSANCAGGVLDDSSLSISANSYYLSSLSHNTTYSFKIVTADLAGNSIDACFAGVSVDTQDPVAATSLKLSADSASDPADSYDDDINFYASWDLPTDAHSGLASQFVELYSQVGCGGAVSWTSSDLGHLATSEALSGANDTVHSFKIVSVDHAGNSISSLCSSALEVDTQDPTSYAVITPNANAGGADADWDADGSFFLAWNASSDAETSIASYTLRTYHSASCGGSVQVTENDIDPATISKSITGGVSGRTYSFELAAIDQAGNSTVTCSSDLTVDLALPVAASSLFASQTLGGASTAVIDSNDVYLRWTLGTDAISGVASQHIYTYETSNCSGSDFFDTSLASSTSSYNLTGLVHANTYSFKVETTDFAGNRIDSSCFAGVLVDTADPVAASSLKLSADNAADPADFYDDDINFHASWTLPTDALSGLASQFVELYSQGSCGGVAAWTSSDLGHLATTEALTGANDIVYSFKVVSLDQAGNSISSVCSGDLEVDTEVPHSSAVITPNASAGGGDADWDTDGIFYLAWTASTDDETSIASYTLRTYHEASCGGSVQVTEQDIAAVTTSKTITGAVDGRTYSFELEAIDQAGNSFAVCSSDITVDKTPPPTFSVLTPNSTSYTNTPSVTWQQSEVGANYTISIDDEVTCSAPYLQTFSSVSGTTQATTALPTGVYYICLEAFDDAGNSRIASNQGYSFHVDLETVALSMQIIDGANYKQQVFRKSGGSSAFQLLESDTSQFPHAASIALNTADQLWALYSTDDGTDLLWKYAVESSSSFGSSTLVESRSGSEIVGQAGDLVLNSSNHAFAYASYEDPASSYHARIASHTGASFSAGFAGTYGSTNTVKDISMAVDSSNNVHGFHSYSDGSNFVLKYSGNLQSLASATFESVTDLPVACDDVLYVDAAVGSDSKAQAAVLCYNSDASCSVLHGIRNGSSDWTFTTIGETKASCSTGEGRGAKPSIALNSSGHAHVSFLDMDAASVTVVNNGSGTFNTTLSVETTSSVDGYVKLAFDSEDHLYVSYVESSTGAAGYFTNANGSWVKHQLEATKAIDVGGIVLIGNAGKSNH